MNMAIKRDLILSFLLFVVTAIISTCVDCYNNKATSDFTYVISIDGQNHYCNTVVGFDQDYLYLDDCRGWPTNRKVLVTGEAEMYKQ